MKVLKGLIQNDDGMFIALFQIAYVFYFMCNRIPSDTMDLKFYEETLQFWLEWQEVKKPKIDIIYSNDLGK